MLYNTNIVSINGGKCIDARGNALIAIGNLNNYVNRNVITDGKVIYGFAYPAMESKKFVFIPKKIPPIIPNPKIPFMFYSSTDVSDTEFTLYYFEQNPPLRRQYELLNMTKAPDIENYTYDAWFNGPHLRLLVKNQNDYFIVNHKNQNWINFPIGSFENITMLDINDAGCGAWATGYHENLQYLWITNADCSSGIYWNFDNIAQDLMEDEAYDHSYTQVDQETQEEYTVFDKVEALDYKYRNYYNHEGYYDGENGLADCVVNARFSSNDANARFICDCCCRVHLRKTTGIEGSETVETITKYIDVHISGNSYSSNEHHRYSTIEIDEGFKYNGANQKMSVEWINAEGKRKTHVFNGIPPNCRGAVINGIPYIFMFSDQYRGFVSGNEICYYWEPLDSELYGIAGVRTSRLRAYQDLQVLADAWNYEEQ